MLLAGCATAQAAPRDDAICRRLHRRRPHGLSRIGERRSSRNARRIGDRHGPAIYIHSVPNIATPTSGVLYTYSSGCNNAAYVSDVTVADGDDMAPGETFTKTWELLNTGSCSWSNELLSCLCQRR